MISLCFVCLGNICRSPTAEGVMLHLIKERGYEGVMSVDSAGTSSYHLGAPADSRSREAARRRKFDLPSRARQFGPDDFEKFDYVLACDSSNLSDLLALAGERYRHKVHLLLDFDPAVPKGTSVPDPYYGGPNGFEEVLDLCESACARLLDFIEEKHELTPR